MGLHARPPLCSPAYPPLCPWLQPILPDSSSRLTLTFACAWAPQAEERVPTRPCLLSADCLDSLPLCQSEGNLLDSEFRACSQPSGWNLPCYAHTCLHCFFCSLRVPHSLLHVSVCASGQSPGSSGDTTLVFCSCVLSLCSSGLTGRLTAGSQHLLIWVPRGGYSLSGGFSSLLRAHFCVLPLEAVGTKRH